MLAADIVVPMVLERQSNIYQQHLKVLKLLIPIYSLAFCDITGCNSLFIKKNLAVAPQTRLAFSLDFTNI